MTWLQMVPAVLAAAALLIVPGLVIAFAIRLRGLTAWAVSFPISITVIALSSLWASLAGLWWSWVPVAITTAAIAVVGIVLHLVFRARFTPAAPERPLARRAVIAGSLVLAALVITVQLVITFGAPGNISQTFDNVFHLNAVRYVLDTGSASPLTLGSMTSDTGGVWFYPSAWHAIVSLIATVSGASIPVATNAVVLVVATLAWPAAVLLLTRTLVPSKNAVVVVAAVLATGCAAFPLLMIDYGVLYPYFLAVAVLPAVLALSIRLLGLGTDRPENTFPLILSGLATLPGLVIAHPGAFVAWLFAAVLLSLWAWARLVRTRPARRVVVVWTVILVAFLAVVFVAWRLLRPPLEARGWPTEQSLAQAFGEVIFQSTYRTLISPVLVVLLWIGVVVVWRLRSTPGRIALMLFALYSLLYVASSALPWQNLRDLISAAWYNNAPRLAALIPLAAIPLAAMGGAWVLAWLQRTVAASDRVRVSATTVTAVAAVVLVAGSQFGGISGELRNSNWIYQTSDDSPLLSTDEYALLERLDDEVPADAVIAGSPWTGTSLAYAIANRDVLMRHILTDVSAAGNEINDELDEPGASDALCAALREENVRYVLEFGGREVHGAEHVYTGLDELAHSDNVELIDEEGKARLYKVTACGMAK